MPFTKDRLVAGEKAFHDALKIDGCMGVCDIYEVETAYPGDAFEGQELFKILVVAHQTKRVEYVETFPANFSNRQCLLRSAFYKDMLVQHKDQIPQMFTERSTGKVTVKPFFHCSSEMAPKASDGTRKNVQEQFLVYMKSTRMQEEIEIDWVADLFEDTALWFRTLFRNREVTAYGQRVEVIFRLMNAKADGFLGAGTGVKRVQKPGGFYSR